MVQDLAPYRDHSVIEAESKVLAVVGPAAGADTAWDLVLGDILVIRGPQACLK